MKIEKFTKLSNGMYKLKLEDSSEIKVYEELILKKEWLLTKDISDEDVNNIDKLNNNYSAYNIAVKYISSKFRSCLEVYSFLEKKEIDKIIIHEVIEKLKSQNYLDDKVYAKAFINDRIKFSNNGPYKIRKELEERGISNIIIEDVLSLFDSSLERDKLSKLVPKYVKTIRNKSYMMMKNKVLDYFSSLGYSKIIVLEFLDDISYDDSSAREKEYDKLYKKFSKKYSGSELDFKLKQAMYKNGFK